MKSWLCGGRTMRQVALGREEKDELQKENAERRLHSEDGEGAAGSHDELLGGESRSELTVTMIVREAAEERFSALRPRGEARV
jgi:hypothetical protein